MVGHFASTEESRVLCEMCGGACCKSGPCSYAPADFCCDDNSAKEIIARLSSGLAVIDARGDYWFVRAPAVGEEGRFIIHQSNCIDNAPCLLLEESGCLLDDKRRPMFGRMIMPHIIDGEVVCDYPREETVSAIKGWADYQDALRNIASILEG